MFELRSSVRFVAGIFQSLSIIGSLCACALWDFTAHRTSDNIYYGCAVLVGFFLNTGICLCMVQGLTTLKSKLFLPYIVCSAFHIVISFSFFTAFLISGIESAFNGLDLYDFLYSAIFFVLSIFWWWSFVVVKAYRNFVREVSGEHILFHNVDFV